MDKEKLLSFIKENNIMPCRMFKINSVGKMCSEYYLGNSSYDCEIIMEKCKELCDWDYAKLAYESYCLMGVLHSQEHEFFID